MQALSVALDQKSPLPEVFMTRTRDFHRFRRRTAQLRRRSLRHVLPEPCEGELQPLHSVRDARCREWLRDQLSDLTEFDACEAAS